MKLGGVAMTADATKSADSKSIASQRSYLLLAHLAEYFDRIYVVSIERNSGRRALLGRDLEGVCLTYVGGVDGHCLSRDEIRCAYDDEAAMQRYGRSLSPGQLGCALSHRRIYEHVVSEGHSRVLVLEDDATPVWENLAFIPPVLEQLPDAWDFLYLFADRSGEPRWMDARLKFLYPLLHHTRIRRYDLERVRKTYSRAYSRDLRIAGQHWGAVAYAITRSTAARMLELQTPVRTVADDVTRMICASGDVNAYVSRHHIFQQRAGMHSTIWNRPPRTESR